MVVRVSELPDLPDPELDATLDKGMGAIAPVT